MATNNVNIDILINTDITNFLTNGKETLICSDFEGTLPIKQIENFESFFTEQSKQIVYLGDIFDNTGGCGDKYSNSNYCALKTLKYLVDYPEKSRYVVGNRDINKIKLVPLLQFADNSKWWLSESDKQVLNVNSFIDENIYIDIVSKLINNNLESWKVKTMTDYVPFWSKKTDELNKKWITKGENYITDKMTTLYDRFLRIFGTDTTVGTMSAENTLKYIPDELFPEIKQVVDSIKTNISDIEKLKTNIRNSTTFIETIKSTNDKKKVKKESMTDEEITNLLNKFIDFEIRSAIVFTVFMRMLDKDLYKPKTMPISFSLNKIDDLDGYLWKYLTTASPALYAKQNNDLLLFSHGGITQEFLKISDNKTGLDILSIVDWNSVLSGKISNNEVILSKDINIINKIESYNKKYFEILNQCFENFKNNEFNKEIMVLLSISAPAENNSVIFKNGYTTSNLSPIQPKLPITSILTKAGEDINVFNFCGHASAGFGYGFKKVADNMYFISTDFSSSLYKKGICSPTYDNNFLSLTIKYDANKFNLNLKGEIFLDSTFIDNKEQEIKDKKTGFNTLIPAFSNGDNFKTIFDSKLEKYQVIVVNDTFENLIESKKISVNQEGVLDDSFFKRNEKYYSKDFIFNGEVTYGVSESKYEQYSYFNFSPPINKNILILSPPPITPSSPQNDEEMLGGNRKKLNKYKSIKKNRKYKTKGKLFKKNSTRNRKMKSNKKY